MSWESNCQHGDDSGRDGCTQVMEDEENFNSTLLASVENIRSPQEDLFLRTWIEGKMMEEWKFVENEMCLEYFIVRFCKRNFLIKLNNSNNPDNHFF